jgi:hypothetical protein
MSCKSGCVEASIAQCSSQIIVKAGLLPATNYFWILQKIASTNQWQRQVTTNGNGDLIIDTTDLPKGLLIPNNYFKLQIRDVNYNIIELQLMNENYRCVQIDIAKINNPNAFNSTISTLAILNNPNNTNDSNYLQVALDVTTNGQLQFALPQIIQNASNTFLFVNGQQRTLGVDYNINGAILNWVSNTYNLDTTDEVIFYYR